MQLRATPRGLGVLLSIAVAGVIHPAASQQARDPAAGSGVLAGQAVDSGSGEPVPGVVISLRRGGGLPVELRRVMTDDRGRFVFTNLEPGAYRISGVKFGYLPSGVGSRHPGGTATPVEIATGQRRLDVVLGMWKYAAIGGRVTDERGEPIVGVQVRSLRRMYGLGRAAFSPSYAGTIGSTDDRGIFRIAQLPPGEYLIAVPAPQTSLPVDVMSGTQPPAVQRELSAVTNEFSSLGYERNQQIGETVLLTRSPFPVPVSIEPSGRVSVFAPAFHPGVSALADATVFTLGSGEERSGADITLRAVTSARVSGQLRGPEGALPHTAVRLLPAAAPDAWSDTAFHTATGLSDHAGRFTLLGVPSGDYVLKVVSPLPQRQGEPSDAPVLTAEIPLALGERDLADLVVHVRPAPRARGRVRVPAGFTGELRDAAEMYFETRDGWPRSFSVPLDDQGRFDVALTPGRYTVLAGVPSGYAAAAVLYDGRDISDEPLAISDSDVNDIVVTITDSPTRVAGSVRDAQGGPLSDAFVVVFPADRGRWSGDRFSPRRVTGVRAASSGAFEIVNLPPGEYFVAALRDDDEPNWMAPARLEVLMKPASRVQVRAGASVTVDLRVAR